MASVQHGAGAGGVSHLEGQSSRSTARLKSVTKRYRCALLLALGIVVLASPGLAQDHLTTYSRNGWYGGIGVSSLVKGFDTTKEDSSPEPPACQEDDDLICALVIHVFESIDLEENPGANVKAGYRLHPRLALEIDYQYLSGFDAEVITESQGASSFETVNVENGYAVTGRAKGFLSTGILQPYGAIGGGVANLNIDGELPRDFSFADLDFVTSFSGGIDFYPTEKLVVYLEASYFLTTGNIKNLDFIPLTLGFLFRF